MGWDFGTFDGLHPSTGSENTVRFYQSRVPLRFRQGCIENTLVNKRVGVGPFSG